MIAGKRKLFCFFSFRAIEKLSIILGCPERAPATVVCFSLLLISLANDVRTATM